MNFREGVRRLFVVFQWLAVALVVVAGWDARPKPIEPWRNDPVVAAAPNFFDQFDEKPRVEQQGREYVTDPKTLSALNDNSPSWQEWAKHIGIFLGIAVLAYFVVFGAWKILDWVFDGFFARRS